MGGEKGALAYKKYGRKLWAEAPCLHKFATNLVLITGAAEWPQIVIYFTFVIGSATVFSFRFTCFIKSSFETCVYTLYHTMSSLFVSLYKCMDAIVKPTGQVDTSCLQLL